MPTLTINGQRVKVDDSFLSLSPEQQNATVDEIAQSLGVTGQKPDPNAAELSALTQQFGPTDKYAQDTRVRANLEATKINDMRGGGALGASADGVMSGAMFGFDDEIGAGMGTLPRMVRDRVGAGEAYTREKALQDELKRRRREDNPVASTVGEIGGAVLLGGSLPSLSAKTAGGGLIARTLAGAGEGAAYGAAYGAGEAESGQRLSGALTGGGVGLAAGAAVPLLGAGLRKGAQEIRTAIAPSREAARRVGEAMRRDAGNAAVSSADDIIARNNNQPVLNVDRGGETTRALARVSANASPEARAAFDRAIDDRFTSQSDRTISMLQRITGGSTDDLALQDSIRNAARVSNKAAYDAALKSPQAQQVFSPKLQELMQAPAIRRAASKVPATSANRSLKDIGNPFSVNSKGQYVLRQKADGTLIAPNLGFWDQVKRNLDDQIGAAQRAGLKSTASDLMSLKSQLVNELDSMVPSYKTARAGAAAAFGAEDAIDAGRMFAKTTRNTPEMQRALGKMTEAEKKAFRTGFASEMIDKVKSTRDRANVIDGMFNKPEAREKLVATFGQAKAREIEAFVRIEAGMDLMRGALGNSTTARQLVELAAIGGGGTAYGFYTGDWSTAAGIAGLGAVRYGRQSANQQVLQKVAELLVSNDKAALQRAITNSGMSAKYLNAVRAITDGMLRLKSPAIGMAAPSLIDQ